MNKKSEILGTIGACIAAVATTLITIWMTKNEIRAQIEDERNSNSSEE